jgi:hypothetical protein
MQEPLNYAADCIRLVGHIIPHSSRSITKQDTMIKSHNEIDEIWKQEFDCDITTDHLYNTAEDIWSWSD